MRFLALVVVAILTPSTVLAEPFLTTPANSSDQTQNDGSRLEFPLFSIETPKGNNWRQISYERGKQARFIRGVPAVEKPGEPIELVATVFITSKAYRTTSATNQEFLANEVRATEERLGKLNRGDEKFINISVRSTPTQISDSDCLQYFFTYDNHRTLGAFRPIYDGKIRGLICVVGGSAVIRVDYNERVLRGQASLSAIEQEFGPLLGSLVIHKSVD